MLFVPDTLHRKEKWRRYSQDANLERRKSLTRRQSSSSKLPAGGRSESIPAAKLAEIAEQLLSKDHTATTSQTSLHDGKPPVSLARRVSASDKAGIMKRRGRSQSLFAFNPSDLPADLTAKDNVKMVSKLLKQFRRCDSRRERAALLNQLEQMEQGSKNGATRASRQPYRRRADNIQPGEAATLGNQTKSGGSFSVEDDGGGGSGLAQASGSMGASGAYGRSQSRATSGSRTDVSTDHEDDGVQKSSSTGPGKKEHPSLGPTMSSASSKGAGRLKSMNRFSNFVKSGMEGYILSPPKIASKPDEKHEIILSNDGPQWSTGGQAYTCVVDKPKKESKLKGLKSFIAYSLTSTLSGIQVSRRFKHFDWLHERLSEKYILTPIPPLPEKQVSGRYDDDLIEHRKQILQLWVNKLCRHPVLNKSDVWIHFVTCTDEKQWKQGKRKAEKDEYVGGNFFQSVSIPAQPLETTDVEKHIDTFSRITRSLDDSVRGLYERAGDTHKRMIGPYKANYQKLGAAFLSLAQSFELDQSHHSQNVTQAMKQAANVYNLIGDLHEQQPKKDLEPLMDSLYAYKGMLSTVPDIINVHKSAMSKLRENEKLSAEGKITAAEAEAVRTRVDTVSYSMLAEINHFHKERVTDFKAIMVDYLRNQVEFYQQMAAQLQGTLSQFENA